MSFSTSRDFADEVISQFLYGAQRPSDLTEESLIRPDNVVTQISVNLTDYFSSTGPGRFARPAFFEIVQKFFGASGSAISAIVERGIASGDVAAVGTSSTGGTLYKIEREFIISELGISSGRLAFNQSQFDDGNDDYARRVFIWSSNQFQISLNSDFIVSSDNDFSAEGRSIPNLSVIPDNGDAPRNGTTGLNNFDNFDFEGAGLAAILNASSIVDPSLIGRTVRLVFNSGVAPIFNYDFSQWRRDVESAPLSVSGNNFTIGTNNGALSGPVSGSLPGDFNVGDDLVAGARLALIGIPFLQDLYDRGVIDYRQDGRDVFYGSVEDDFVSISDSRPFQALQAIASGVAVGGIAVGGPGKDSFRGFSGNDRFIIDRDDTFVDGGRGIDTVEYSPSGANSQNQGPINFIVREDDEILFPGVIGIGNITRKVLRVAASVGTNTTVFIGIESLSGTERSDILTVNSLAPIDNTDLVIDLRGTSLQPAGADGLSTADTLNLEAYSTSGVLTTDLRNDLQSVIDSEGGKGLRFKGVEGIRGSNGVDRIFASNSGDDIRGGLGKDELTGGSSNDRIVGASETTEGSEFDDNEVDLLFGGGGSDEFYAGDGDVIQDPGSGDRIYVRGQLLTGGTQIDENTRRYDSNDGGIYEYSENGTLTYSINPSITIENFRNGDAGIRLIDKKPDDDRAEELRDPLIIDLDGDRNVLTRLSGSTAYFDLDNDGFAERVAWAGRSDGFLVRDINGDGTINNGTEMFGTGNVALEAGRFQQFGEEGFAELSLLDSDLNGAITASDVDFAELRVWIDANGDALTDEGELVTLEFLGIVSISLSTFGSDHVAIIGDASVITRASTVGFSDGGTRTVYDAYLAINQYDAREILDDVTIDESISELPLLLGTGNLSDLDVAMSRDAGLEELVRSFAMLEIGEAHEILERTQAILLRWTGADRIAQDSRGPNINAQWLHAIETITGSDFDQAVVGANPRADAASILIDEWKELVARTAAKLVGQTALTDILTPGLSFEAAAFFTAQPDTTLQSVLDNLLANAPSDEVRKVSYWAGAIALLDQYRTALGESTPGLNQLVNSALSQSGLAFSADELRSIIVVSNGDDFAVGRDKRSFVENSDDLILVTGSSDRIDGLGGNDRYVVGKGAGSITLFDKSGDDALYLLDHTAAEIEVRAVRLGGRFWLTITDEAGQLNLRVRLGLSDTEVSPDIETVFFADGSSADILSLIQSSDIGDGVVLGGESPALIVGSSSDELLIGVGAVNDYSFGPGSGNDTVSDARGANDRVIVNANVGDVSFSVERTGLFDDVVIRIDSTGETLRIVGQRSTIAKTIEQFVFNDDTLSLVQLDRLLNTGTDGDDVIVGSIRDDVIEGRGGNDELRGGGGRDTYQFNSGWGHDRILDANSANVVSFGSGISVSDIAASRGENGDLILRSSIGDELTIVGGLRSPIVTEFIFDGGATKTLLDFISELGDSQSNLIVGTVIDEELVGTDASEIFIGGGGVDLFFGNGGSDTFQVGDGFSRILTGSSGIDTLLAPANVELRDLRFDLNFGLNLRFGVRDSGVLADAGLDLLQLESGQLIALGNSSITAGTDQDDFLYDLSGTNAIFTPGAGDDVIIGSTRIFGGDTYRFELGFGNDIIYDLGGLSDAVQFLSPELSLANATLDRIGSDLVIAFASGDTLTVEGYYWSHPYFLIDNTSAGGIETFRFGDGQVLSNVVINTEISSQTDGNDWVLVGAGGRRDGGAGDDILVGGRESNEYVFASGYGHDLIKDDGGFSFSPNFRDSITFAGLEAADVAISRDANDPLSVVFTIIATGETLTVDGSPDDGFFPDGDFRSGRNDRGFTIESAVFESTSLDRDDVLAAAFASSASDGDDFIFSLRSSATIDGGLGNDFIDISTGQETVIIGPESGHDVVAFDPDGSQSGSGNTPFIVEFQGFAFEDLVFVEVDEVDGQFGRHLRIFAGESSVTILNGLDTRFSQFFDEVGLSSRIEIRATEASSGGFLTNPDFGGDDFILGNFTLGRRSALTQGTESDDFLQADPSEYDAVIDPLAGEDVIFGNQVQDRVVFDVGYGVDRYLSNGGSLTVEIGEGLTASDIEFAWSQSDPGLIELTIIGTQDRLLFEPQVAVRILVGGEILTTIPSQSIDPTTLPLSSVDPDDEIMSQPNAERIIATGGSAAIVIGAISGADFIEDARFEAAVNGTDDLSDWSPNTLIIEGVSDVADLRFLIEDRDPATLVIEKPNGERITLTNQFGLGLPEFVRGYRSPDLDGDGTPDWDRIDFDNDGTPDFDVLDTNADGAPDWLDADYDGDGASDWIDVTNAEAIFAGGDVFAQDFDRDGNFDIYYFSLADGFFTARDVNGDGIADEYSEDELVWTSAPTNAVGEVDWSLLDINGTGVADLQGFADGTGPTWLSGFDAQVGNPDWSVTVYGELNNAEGDFIAERVIDLATGATDYVVFGTDTVFVPPFFFTPGTNYLARDTDGDGEVDLVGFDADGDGQPDTSLDQSTRAAFGSFVLRDISSPFGEEISLSLADILERIEFITAPNETFLDLNALRPAATEGADSLLLGTGDELDSLGGDDVITSYGEGGTFRWSAGDGNDVFRSTLRFPAGAFEKGVSGTTLLDTIKLDGILDPDQLRYFASADNPSDLVLETIETGERLTIAGQLGAPNELSEAAPPVGRFVFERGLELSAGEVALRTRGQVLVGDNVQTTNSSGGLLDAGAGDDDSDMLIGGIGDDVYRFGRDYAEDTIMDAGGFDTIQFGTDISADDIFFSRSGDNGGDLLVEVLGLERLTLTISGQFLGESNRIESFAFDDGSRLDWRAVQQIILDRAETVSDDAIVGFDGDDILRGGKGNDSLTAAGGDDELFGGEGRDQAIFTGSREEYIVTEAEGVTIVTDTIAGRDGTNRLESIEDLVFLGDGSTTMLRPPNSAPVVGELQFDVDEDGTLIIDSTALFAAVTDADGDMLELGTLSNTENGQAWTCTDGNLRFRPNRDFAGVAGFDFSISDGNGGVTSARVTVSVIGTNDAPRIAVAQRTFTTFEDNVVDWVLPAGSISDPDGDALTISARLSSGDPLPGWLIFDGSRFTGTPPSDFNGAIDIELTAEDGSAIASTSLQIEILPINDAPRQVNELPDRELRPGEAFSFTLPTDAFFDVEGDPISFEVVAGDGGTLPAWITLDGLNVSGTVPEDLIDPVLFALIASDGAAANLATFAIVPVLNSGPQIGIPLQSVSSDEDEVFSFTLPADAFVDADGDTLSLSAALANGDPLPSWLSFDNARFSGIPPQDFSGALEIVVSASDGQLSASQSLTVTIDPVNDAPIVVAPLDDVTVQGGEALSINLGDGTFADVDGDTLTLSASLADGSALPVWLSFDGTSLTAANVPLLAQQLQVIVTASDGLLTVSDEFLLTVEPGNIAPIANDDGVFFTTSNRALVVSPDSLLANDSDPQGGAIQITGVQNAVGGEVRFDADGNIVFTPDAVFVGNARFTYTLSDGELASEAVVSITVDPSDQFDGFRQGNNSANLMFGSLFGRNRIFGAGGNDIITGGLSNDELAGGDGDDVIFGLLGNDNLWGGQGNDQLFGGFGFDTAYLFGNRSSYQIVTSAGLFSLRVTDLAPGVDGNDGVDQLSSIEQLSFRGGETLNIASPIILDLDGNGVETLSAADSDARFDLDGDGLADDTSWIGAGDAFLYLDRDANGTVSGVEEISFIDDVPDAATDLAGLRAFDSNSDGILDARDERFADFGVWRDADGDGAVDEGETASLATVGIRSVNLTGTPVDAVTEFGEVAIANTGSFTLTNGTTRTFADAALTYFSAATNLPSLGVTHYDFGRKASKYRISAAGGALTVAPKNAGSGRNPLAGQLGANSILTFRGRDYGLFAPVVLDLDGDGVELVSRKKSRASFDYSGDGAGDDTGWIGRDDGFLVIDRNNDGLITEASELSLASEDEDARSGLQGLARLDSNGDGVIDSEDARFGELRVWQDRNGNGRTDAGELRSLEEAGLVAIRLNAVTPSQAQVKLDRNVIAATTTFVRANGTTSTAADVSLAYRPVTGNTTSATSLASSFDRFGSDLFLAPFRDTGFEREALLPTIDELVGLLGNASSQGISDLFDRYAAESAVEPARSQPALTLPPVDERASVLSQRAFDPVAGSLTMLQDYQQQFLPDFTIELQANHPLPIARVNEALEPDPVLDQRVSSIAASESLSAIDPNVVEANPDGSPVGEVAAQPATPQLGSRPLLDPAQYAIWGGPAWIAGLPQSPDQSVELITPTAHVVRPGVDLAAVLAQPDGDATASNAEVARKLAMIRQDMSSFGIAGAGELERMRQFEPQGSYLYA